MLHVAVVEDETEYRGLIQEMVGRYAKEYDLQIQTTAFQDGRELVQNYQKFDILLMDIEMPHLNGMEAAQKIRGLDKEVVIVFITNMAQYALAGYEVSAMDFIVKPVNFYDFAMKIKRALKKVTQFEQDAITVVKKESINRIPIHDILYIEVMNHRVYYHLENEKIDVFGALKDVEDQIKNFHFARCNRCYLVNLSHVRKVQDDEVYINDERLSISRSQKKSFLEAFVHYLSL